MRSVNLVPRGSAAIAAILAACGGAAAQSFEATFESPMYMGSAAGTPLDGQNSWYIPPVTGSLGMNVFTYSGNTLGIAPNPLGGDQFVAGHGMTTGAARGQHTVDFSSGGVWMAEWDCTGLYVGTLPAVNNIGSWSMQDSISSRYFQQLMSWGGAGNTYVGPNSPPPDRLATADLFHIHWGIFTAASPTTIAFAVPGPEWLDLPVNHWYHVTVKWDFDAAQILEVSIRDITAGGPTTTNDVTSLGWYLRGGPNSTDPLPTDIRVFAGGADDVSGWDNLRVYKVTTGPSCYANCDQSTAVPFLNVNDFICFQSAFAAGCSAP